MKLQIALRNDGEKIFNLIVRKKDSTSGRYITFYLNGNKNADEQIIDMAFFGFLIQELSLMERLKLLFKKRNKK